MPKTARRAAVRGGIFYTTAVFSRGMRENMPVKTLPRILLSLALAVLCFAAVPARAALVPGLYEARVPVADQSSATRSSALQQAFGAVLVKITGARTVPAQMNPILGSAMDYVQQYRYEQAPEDP